MVVTVYELLTELSKYPPDMQVYFPTIRDEYGEDQQYEVVGAEIEREAVVLLD